MILALIRRWWHCLTNTFSKWPRHRVETWYSSDNKVLGIACECGRVFWVRPIDPFPMEGIEIMGHRIYTKVDWDRIVERWRD